MASGDIAAGGEGRDGRISLQLSRPLFSWDTSVGGEGVSFDELHQRIIHRRRGGFSTADLLEEGTAPDGLCVQCDLQGLRQVRFSPDGLYFAFLCNERHMGLMETLHTSREPLLLTLKWSKLDLEVLNFFWLPAAGPDYAELVVITTQGLEVFRLTFDTYVAKSTKTLPTPARLCWVEPLTAMVLVCTGPRTLQPFDFKTKAPKLPKFDLVLGHGQVIELEDVAVMPVYDSTFCIHADSSNGRVSLRNISNPTQGMPEHDIVIDIADEDVSIGTLRLSNVDNLLVVHCVDREVSAVFDIRHKERGIVPCISGPCPLGCGDSGDASLPWQLFSFINGSTIVDSAGGNVHQLKLDMAAVLQDFLARTPNDLAAVMRFLLRRTDCREHIVWTLTRALSAKPCLNDWAQAFAVLNQAYRQSIEAVSQKAPSGPGRQTTVSLQELEALISHQSILSENHMVSQVFHPHLLGVTGLTGISSGAAQAEGLPPQDRWRIPLPSVEATQAAAVSSRPARSPYVQSVVVAYLRSLLGMQILPHKILQCFVFDVCMYFQQEHTLQQLLHYHVLLDSPELVARLKEVATTRITSRWAVQACLDMALRIDELAVVGDLLLHTRQYLDLVPFLVNQRQPTFKLSRLLSCIEADADARADDPELVAHVVSEIRAWAAEAAASATASSLSSDSIRAPDLEDCAPWMPELAPVPAAVCAAA